MWDKDIDEMDEEGRYVWQQVVIFDEDGYSPQFGGLYLDDLEDWLEGTPTLDEDAVLPDK